MRLQTKAMLVAFFALTGCVRDVQIENEPGRVTSVGPIQAAAPNVMVRYTIRDFEGDDQNVRVLICEAGREDCGPAIRGTGGDPTTRVPAVPAATDVLHEFSWNPWCGRYVDGVLVESEPDVEYITAVDVLGSELGPVYSEVFTLESLGLDSPGDCE